MATPVMIVKSASMQIIPGTPGTMRINTLDAVGAALDVSSGYTMKALKVDVSSGANPLKAAADLKGNFTFTWDATGFSVNWTAAQATALAALLPSLNCACGVILSNDASATGSLAASGTITLQPQTYLG